ncbi:hypothetical protein L7F22_011662 [Adiantum nelumboides]|nr:hypothetical protein [Adiantum nelumboides]
MSKNDGISGLVSDKLDKNNFHVWKFKMTNFLMGKGYWDYIDGNQEDMPKLPDVNPTAEQIKAFIDWNQGARKVMYWLSISVHDTMIGHIQDATAPKKAWDRLVSVDTTNTKARKIQLKNELNTVKKENLSINDYTLKIKVRRTLRYVSATLTYALLYEASTELQLSGFIDADWAGSVCDRQSTSGFLISLGSAAITWSSKKQPTVALSSTKVEYRGAVMAACEVAWLELLLGDLGI